MSAQTKPAPARRARTPMTEKPSRPSSTEPEPAPTDRTPGGRFAAGNPGGPGNPHARHCARMLALLRASICGEEMVAIIRMLVTQALARDVSAAKLVLSYKLGKASAAPNPDEIDRDEWEHFQRDTINLQEAQQVLGSLPARVGNDIARTALPIMTQARQEALASQLVANLPDARKATEEGEVATAQPREAAPISNGKSSNPNDTNRSTRIDSRESNREDSARKSSRLKGRATATDSRPSTNDNRSTTNDSRSTHRAPRSTNSPPLPNRKSKLRPHGKTKPKKVKPEWLRQTAKRIQKNGPAKE